MHAQPPARHIGTLRLIIIWFFFRSLSAQVTTPEEFLGFKPGADFHLATYEQAIGYFEHIAGETDRMKIYDMGPTSEGRRMKYAIISSEENMARLDHYQEINRRLTLVRGVDEAEAHRLADEGRAVIWIDCGLHATETSPAQHAAQLAYDIVAGEDERTRSIREEVIFLLVFANPDGMTLVSKWYHGNLGTPYEISRPPVLYHKYAGHDNNRDSFIANLQETQNMNRTTCHEWFPHILYNQHETAPFPARIWIPPESEPMNPNVHPIIARWKNLIGAAMGKAFEEANQPGAISRIVFDSWYPGYVTQFVGGHNIPSILTETANYRYATPHYYTLYDFPERYRDLTEGVFYPTPWRGGWWRLSDAVAYNLTASKAILELAAKYRRDFLFNKWKMGRDVMDRFLNEPPYGWIVPADQRDMTTTSIMLNRCILNGIQVYRADASFEHNGISYPAGSFIIPTSQPFGLFTKNVLERQSYPDLKKYTHLWQGTVGTASLGKEPIRAYDGVGWTMPLQMGVDYQEMSQPLDVTMTPVEEIKVSPSGSRGTGPHLILSSADNGSYTVVNRILRSGGSASRATAAFSAGERRFPRGSFIIDGSNLNRVSTDDLFEGVSVQPARGRADVRTTPIRATRIGLYKSWVASSDAGWLSLLLETYAFRFRDVRDAEIRAGRLRERFDVIMLPDQRTQSIIEGHRKGTMPPDYVGGISGEGAQNLRKFVEAGGVLVCNKSSSDLAVKEFRFPIRNVLQDVKPDSFYCPGSILRMIYKDDHPLTAGMETESIAFFSRGMVFETIEDSAEAKPKPAHSESKEKEIKDAKPNPKPRYVDVEPRIVATFPEDHILLSGFLQGGDLLKEKASIMEVPFGKGRVILFGFNVQNRVQAHGTFKLLFNVLYR